jgi:ribosome-binding protein aMBF1 (putative translation factor)
MTIAPPVSSNPSEPPPLPGPDNSAAIAADISFGQQVRARRRQEKLSQEELAQRVQISRNYLSQIERGQSTNLSWQVRQRINAVLGPRRRPVAYRRASRNSRRGSSSPPMTWPCSPGCNTEASSRPLRKNGSCSTT